MQYRPCWTVALFLVSLGCAGSTPATVSPEAAPVTDEIQRANDASVQRILATIAGREREPAGTVFRNVSYLRDVPASTFLSIMNGGYAKALGVRCSHCHEVTNYASDEKRPKRAAREMQVMHRSINQSLRGMQHIETPADQNRAISCVTCHRGRVNPR